MKRIPAIFVMLCSVLFSFCTKDDSFAGDMPSGGEPDAPLSEIRSVDEALGELSDLLDVIDDKQTRSGKYRTIRSVTVSGGAATRGSENPLPDTLVYVVNFDNGEGFAILGAHRALPPVYAITESGTFDASELTSDIALLANTTYDEVIETRAIVNNDEDEENEEPIISNMGPRIMTTLVANDIVRSSMQFKKDSLVWRIDTTKIHPVHLHAVSSGRDTVVYTRSTKNKYGPWVHLKWDQGKPFDLYCPEKGKEPVNNQEIIVDNARKPVGCVMVALGQIMTCVERPNPIKLYATAFSWNEFRQISTYWNYKEYIYEKGVTSWTREDNPDVYRLALFLKQLGSGDYCRATYKDDSTSASDTRARRTLEKLGYKNVKLCDYSLDKVRSHVKSCKPLYVSAYRKESGEKHGHAWVLDGYWNFDYWQVGKRVYSDGCEDIEYKTYLGNETYVHCNFGWRGDADGYYLSNVFNTAMRQTYEDEGQPEDAGFDSGENTYITNPRNYCIDVKIITYNL